MGTLERFSGSIIGFADVKWLKNQSARVQSRLATALFVLGALATPGVQRLAVAQSAVIQTQDSLRSTYILGADDQITVRVRDVEEFNEKPEKPIRVEMDGSIKLPLAGRITAAGLTVEQLEATVAKSLLSFVRQPEVVVSIAEFRSQPVSVIGSVKSPGVHQLQGRKTLVEVLSMA